MRRNYQHRFLFVLLVSHPIQGFLPLLLYNTDHCKFSDLRTHRRVLSTTSQLNTSSRNSNGNRRRPRSDGLGGKGDNSSRSKHRAISALSQPKTNADGGRQKDKTNESLLPPPPSKNGPNNKAKRKHKRVHMKRRNSDPNSFDGPRAHLSTAGPKRQREGKETDENNYSSLLPPPLKDTIEGVDEEELSPALSSWDDFLSGSRAAATNSSVTLQKQPKPGKSRDENTNTISSDDTSLPSIDDLFPPTVSSINSESTAETRPEKAATGKSLGGVLPVSDLFFRSPNANLQKDKSSYSEQNSTASISSTSDSGVAADGGIAEMAKTPAAKKRTGRRMVRRGMEMLVGGRPVNADPPLRCVDVIYNPRTNDWASTVLLNSRDYGPLLHIGSVDRVAYVERGLYCEHFVNAALKWDVCPSDLKQLVKDHALQQEKARSFSSSDGLGVLLLDSQSETQDIGVTPFDTEPPLNENIRTHDEEDEEDGMLTIQVKTRTTSQFDFQSADVNELELDDSESSKTDRGKGSSVDASNNQESQDIIYYEFGGAIFEFDVGLSLEDLQSGDPDYEVLKSILSAGVMIALKDELHGFDIEISHFNAVPIGDTRSSVSAEFNMKCVELEHPVEYDDIEQQAETIMAAFADAIEGDLGLALAEAARQEHGWSKRVREAFVEECLDMDDRANFDDDDKDEEGVEEQNPSTDESGLISNEYGLFDGHDRPFEKKLFYPSNDIFLGNGNGGVFYDYSMRNIANSPYSGKLGLRLVDAVVERAKQRQPRVIVVGDVHGCIDELQDLLRQCDYRPGDLVVFLGDLVCKGPDSTSVVQMAREIGAIGVRGNHDFEVIRWHQAIKSGVDPPVVGSEHYHVASCLTKADIKWLYSLPWFMSSKDLGALFVHAGFVSGVRLAKQNPRLMMNMRSILPDGTVTSKFFNNWPWARLWDGPQTVLFGHDADRGLQQYEHAIGLDTGCVYGGRLTACILPERRLVSVAARRSYFKYRRRRY